MPHLSRSASRRILHLCDCQATSLKWREAIRGSRGVQMGEWVKGVRTGSWRLLEALGSDSLSTLRFAAIRMYFTNQKRPFSFKILCADHPFMLREDFTRLLPKAPTTFRAVGQSFRGAVRSPPIQPTVRRKEPVRS